LNYAFIRFRLEYSYSFITNVIIITKNMASLSAPKLTRAKTEAPLNAPGVLTRSQTTVVDEDGDDVLEELPELEYDPPKKFDGSKSTSTAESLVDFLQTFKWRTSNLADVPGIGPASISKLKESGITTVQQLVGIYMGFVALDASANDINNEFYNWFKEQSPNANGHTVTFAIAHLADRFGIVLYED